MVLLKFNWFWLFCQKLCHLLLTIIIKVLHKIKLIWLHFGTVRTGTNVDKSLTNTHVTNQFLFYYNMRPSKLKHKKTNEKEKRKNVESILTLQKLLLDRSLILLRCIQGTKLMEKWMKKESALSLICSGKVKDIHVHGKSLCVCFR